MERNGERGNGVRVIGGRGTRREGGGKGWARRWSGGGEHRGRNAA